VSEAGIEFQISTAHQRAGAILRDFDDPDQLPEDHKPVLCALWKAITILAL